MNNTIAYPRIFIFIDWFYPAYKAGGPVVATVNFVNYMKDFYEVYVFTGDTDLGEKKPLQNIASNRWIEQEKNVKIFYASSGYLTLRAIKDQLRTIGPSYIYINSIYSKNFSLLPLLVNRYWNSKSKIILAPRGMLKASAVSHKRIKKTIFLRLFRILKLQKDIFFHATDETEQQDIKRYFGDRNQVYLVSDFVAAIPPYKNSLPKVAGEVKMIFVGRIHPIKNLLFVLECLSKINQTVVLTIIGNIEDTAYWEVCELKIKALPSTVTIDMKNDLPHAALWSLLMENHVFILPTKGENFGHAIFEAMAAGKPVIISDQTPWQKLNIAHAGWDLSLNNPEQFIAAIEEVINWDNSTYQQWSKNAWSYINENTSLTNTLGQYKKMFS